MKVKLTSEMEEINEFFKDFPKKIYYVGGCVRDLCMKQTPKDYDLFTSLPPDDTETWIKSKGRRVWKQGKRFGTLGVKLNNQMVEVTTYRKELYDFKGRKPSVEYTELLDEDLQRRDFTINAMYCDAAGNVKDPYDGLKDIEEGVLRAVGNPRQRFKEDPLRILRAIRFASKYSFKMEGKTRDRLESGRWQLLRISKERIREEIEKMFILEPQQMVDALVWLWHSKIFQIINPSLQLQLSFNQHSRYHDFELYVHTLHVVRSVREMFETAIGSEHYIWAALLHDIAKPYVQTEHKSGEYCNYISHDELGAEMCESWLRHYKFSNSDREFIVDTIRDHLSDDCWLRSHDNKHKKEKVEE